MRADRLLVERGLFESRAKAQAAIAAGNVTADGAPVRKASDMLAAEAFLQAAPEHPWVSRGGLKLAAALDHFGFDPRGRACLDVGASTGGFTDCLLQRGAAHVTALDVGHNQIAYRLRTEPRVSVVEGVNARYLDPARIGVPFELIVVDVSFISLTLVLPPIFGCLAPGGFVIVLIKPQFELDPTKVGKGGVVRDSKLHDEAVDKVYRFVTGPLQREWLGVIESPIRGAKGNREFLACLR
jgi:23S rRNA (cytidine1920-2'-O)/16S rRNA (cytidine1409-2'-O)-methyltransferase